MRQVMEHRDPSSPTTMPTILRYGIAVLSVAIAVGLDFFVLRHFEAILTPFLFAVAATVWYAGTGPSVLAVVLSVLSLNHFFLRPDFSFGPISYADLVYLTFCIFCALAVGWVSAVRRRTEQELRQARDELEVKVLERTADLQRSESYLAETQKLTHTGSWTWDARSQKVLYCSDEMFRIYGLDPRVDLPTRKNFRQRVHPEDRNRTDQRFLRVINEKVDSFDEYRVLLPDGTIKHVNSTGHPVLDGNGEFIAFIGTATDVTERTRAEQALREREARIRRLVEANIIGIFISGLKGRILEANDAFLRVIGYGRDDLVSGRIRWTDLTPPEWRERDRRALAELSSNTIAQPYEKEFFRKDGSRVPVLIGGALFEEGGNEGVAFVLDLTERKRAEEALREREAKIRRLVDSNIIGIFIWDFDGRVLEANDEFLRMVSYDREDLFAGRIRWADLTPADWRDRNNVRIEQQKSSGRFEPFEKEFTRKDGSRVPILIGGATFEEGGNQGVAFVLDLTERKRDEERLRVQHMVAQILAEAVTIDQATPRILRAMGECLGWDLGALWRVDREAEALCCVELWHRASIEVPEFGRVSRERTFAPGLGLPGRVWSSLEPEYVPDVVADENFPRGPIAEREGLHAAFGFPILLGGEVLGVIEFFSREIRQPDRELLNMLATIGSQIGQFIERKRAEDAFRKVQMQLEH